MNITAYQFSVGSREVVDKIFHHYDSAKYSVALNPGGQYPLHAMPSLLQLQEKLKLFLTLLCMMIEFVYITILKINASLTQLTEKKSNCVLTQGPHHCNK